MSRDSGTRELVAQALQDTRYAPPRQAERTVEDWASRLAAHGAEDPRRFGLDRELLCQAEELLGAMWSRGFWRPADVVRYTRRQLKPAHVALAVGVIAAEARRYSPAAFDRRWAEQLRELDADRPAWSEDAAWLDETSAGLRLDRFSTLIHLLELLRLWGTAPVLTQVGPVPGASGQSAALTGPVPGEPKQLARIRALLAKAEATTYAEEAEAFTAKAQELMARHSIDEALLAARSGDRTLPAAIRIGIDNPYESAKALLLDAVASANRAQAVWDKQNGFCTVVGFDADLDAVELLFTSLLVQSVAAMNSGKVQQGGRSKAFRQSFLVAYASRIRERLAAATATAQAEAETPAGNLLPVLAARQEAVEERTTVLFPRLRKGRAIRVSDLDGWERGREAADRANLHSSKPLPRR